MADGPKRVEPFRMVSSDSDLARPALSGDTSPSRAALRTLAAPESQPGVREPPMSPEDAPAEMRARYERITGELSQQVATEPLLNRLHRLVSELLGVIEQALHGGNGPDIEPDQTQKGSDQ